MEPPPERSAKHDALQCFFGAWKAEGISFGGTDQSDDPKGNGEPWLSTHSAKWHTGSFFMIQDECAKIAGRAFDTLSVMGVDLETGDYFARTFENHGFYRDYELDRDGDRYIANSIIDTAKRMAPSLGASEETEELYWRFLVVAAIFPFLGMLFLRDRAELWIQAIGVAAAATAVLFILG